MFFLVKKPWDEILTSKVNVNRQNIGLDIFKLLCTESSQTYVIKMNQITIYVVRPKKKNKKKKKSGLLLGLFIISELSHKSLHTHTHAMLQGQENLQHIPSKETSRRERGIWSADPDAFPLPSLMFFPLSLARSLYCCQSFLSWTVSWWERFWSNTLPVLGLQHQSRYQINSHYLQNIN